MTKICSPVINTLLFNETPLSAQNGIGKFPKVAIDQAPSLTLNSVLERVAEDWAIDWDPPVTKYTYDIEMWKENTFKIK